MDSMKSQIEQLLRDFWRDRAIALGELPGSTEDLGAPLDSMTTIEAIMEIDTLLDCKLPVEKIIRQGGYESEEDFVSEVTTRVLQVVAENTP